MVEVKKDKIYISKRSPPNGEVVIPGNAGFHIGGSRTGRFDLTGFAVQSKMSYAVQANATGGSSCVQDEFSPDSINANGKLEMACFKLSEGYAEKFLGFE